MELTPERLNAILEETSPTYDWSAEIVAEATLDDLEPMALQKAREEYKSVHHNMTSIVSVRSYIMLSLIRTIPCRKG